MMRFLKQILEYTNQLDYTLSIRTGINNYRKFIKLKIYYYKNEVFHNIMKY